MLTVPFVFTFICLSICDFLSKKPLVRGFDEVFILPKYYIKPLEGLMDVMRFIKLLMDPITLP
jgi:hypothetical protein